MEAKRTASSAENRSRALELRKKSNQPTHPAAAIGMNNLTDYQSLPAVESRDSFSSTAFAEILDRATHASLAKATSGLSPASLMAAYFDWLVHLSMAPGKRLQLAEKAVRKWMRLQRFIAENAMNSGRAEPCIEPLAQDRRFRDEAWRNWPFNVFYQSHLLVQQWWHVATTGVPGVSHRHERVLEFTSRQILDKYAPSNFVLSNPELLERTRKESGQNFIRGFQNLIEDMERAIGNKTPPHQTDSFRPGHEVAVTPGKVIYRNRLIELIQYEPTTNNVHAEPILIVPAWIMKYYILDLSPENSLIKHLTDKGFTVFTISWTNPGPDDRDLSLDDYRNLGVTSALSAISYIVPEQKIHGVGYCLGGTLLAIAAASLSRSGGSPFQSLTFLAAQVDFEEPGELQLFIDESQLRFLEDMMWEQGFLDATQMSGAFQLLRSNDLIWSRAMRDYLLGDRAPMNDLMAWNADATRMPYRMHSEYLRKLYLYNDLAEGRFTVEGRPVSVTDIREPIFCVGTVKDHVAPWKSVYKWNHLADSEVTFLLTTGGHNTGIISQPGHPHRTYQVATRTDDEFYIDPETWARRTPIQEGSWWPAWVHWLAEKSSSRTPPPTMGAPDKGMPPLEFAPGTYIHQK